MKKMMIAVAVSLSLLAPVAQAGIMKKLIIGSAIVYGANALANNYKQKQQQQQPNQYGQQPQPQPQPNQNPQNYQQYQPNQVNRPYSPNY